MDNKISSKQKNGTEVVWYFIKKSLGLFILTMLSSVIMAVADMLVPQVIRVAVDNCVGDSAPANIPVFVLSIIEKIGGFSYLGKHLWIMAVAVLVIAAIRAVFTYVFRVSNTTAAERMVKAMRDELYEKILHLPFSWHQSNKTGDIISRCTTDIETIRSFIADKLSEVLRIMLLLIFSMVFMLTMNVKLSLIAFAPIPIIVVYSIYFHKRLIPGFMECDVNEGILSDMAQENFTGVRVVKAFGRERYELDRFTGHNKYYTGLWIKQAKFMAGFWSFTDVLSGIQILLVVVFGTVFCVNKMMLPGEYIAFISYNTMLSWPIRELGRMIVDLSKTGVSVDRISYILNSESESEIDDSKKVNMNGDIVFDHVSFSYDGPEIIKDVSFSVKGGTTLGILGGTGSGKSTLMLLLDKLYELPEGKGKVTIDGVDTREINTEYLRKNIGYVLQEPYLFSRSLKENIAIAVDNPDMDKIKSATKSACLSDTIDDFKNGYDTFVGERGVTLSGGQKQRAAIARTLMQHPSIMIFDDSLSAVDTETDEKIRKALAKEFGTATIILISHRISTVSKADKIIVLDKGKLVEEGTHESLMSSGGIYSKIANIQKGGARDEE